MLNQAMAVVTGVGSLTLSCLVLGLRWASGTFGASPTCATRMAEVILVVLYIFKPLSDEQCFFAKVGLSQKNMLV